MRVIAGCAKGHKLQTPEGMATRPTTDRIKETVFNIMAFDLPQCRFLDLFSGSGAIGIEALSRGAAQAVFVDSAPESIRVIHANLAHTKLEENALVLGQDVFSALERLSKEGYCFDVIYMDPPYAAALEQDVLLRIASLNLLAHDGYVAVEHGAKQPLSALPGYHILREKVYKTTVITFLALEE